MRRPRSSGFIALMSAIIIATVLLLIAVTGGLTSFYTRSNVLDSELKYRSEAVADACVDQTFLLIANDPTYTGSDSVHTNDIDQCSFTVQGGGNTKTITVQGISSHATTNLVIVYEADSSAVTSWKEVATGS